ncbi:hypothetical protein AB205_0101750, partial [Aquarana catesbeiana]
MSNFENFNQDFYQTSYSIDDQSQGFNYNPSGGQPKLCPCRGDSPTILFLMTVVTKTKLRQYYDYGQQGGFIPPDMMNQQQPYTGQIYQPTQTYTPTSTESVYGSSFDDEPPLLEGKIFGYYILYIAAVWSADILTVHVSLYFENDYVAVTHLYQIVFEEGSCNLIHSLHVWRDCGQYISSMCCLLMLFDLSAC